MRNLLLVTTAIISLGMVGNVKAQENIAIHNTQELNSYLNSQVDFAQSVIIDATSVISMYNGKLKAADLLFKGGALEMDGSEVVVASKKQMQIDKGASITAQGKSKVVKFYNSNQSNVINVEGNLEIDDSSLIAETIDENNFTKIDVQKQGKLIASGNNSTLATGEININEGGELKVWQNSRVEAVASLDVNNAIVDEKAKQSRGQINVASGGLLNNDGILKTNGLMINNNGKIYNGDGAVLEMGITGARITYNAQNADLENKNEVKIVGDVILNKANIRGTDGKNEGKVKISQGDVRLDNSTIATDELSYNGGEKTPAISDAKAEKYAMYLDNNSILATNKDIKLENADIYVNKAEIQGRVTAQNVDFNIGDSAAKIKKISGADNLNIKADTSITNLLSENSTVNDAIVEQGVTLVWDSLAPVTSGVLNPGVNLTVANKLEVQGRLVAKQSDDVNVAKQTFLKGGELELGYNKFDSKVVFDEQVGGSLLIGVKNATETTTQNGMVSEIEGTDIGENAKIRMVFGNEYSAANTSPQEIIIAENGLSKKVYLESNPLYKYYLDGGQNLLIGNILSQNSVFVQKKDEGDIIDELQTAGLTVNEINTIVGFSDGEGNNQEADDIAKDMADFLQNGKIKEAGTLARMVAPETAPMIQSQVTALTNQIFATISRKTDKDSVEARQGWASGDEEKLRGGIWAQGLTNHSKLDKNDGFEIDTDGIAFGGEKYWDKNSKAGLGYAYSEGKIKAEGHRNDVETNTIFAYAKYQPGDWYVKTMLSYNWGNYDEVKYSDIKAKYDVNSMAVQALAGYDWQKNGIMISPEAGFRYINTERKSYTDSVGQTLKSENDNFLTALIGATIKQEVKLEKGLSLRPEIKLGMFYDVSKDDTYSRVFLTNGAVYEVNGDSLDRFGMEAGVGLMAEFDDKIELNINYDGHFRKDYEDHSGWISAKYKF